MSNKNFLRAVLAGIAISLGGTASLMIKSLDNSALTNIIGSLVFPFGIIMVVFLYLDLFTGKIADLAFEVNNKNIFLNKIRKLILMLLINLIVCVLFGFIVRFIYIDNQQFINYAESIAAEKSILSLENSLKVLLSSTICGALVFLSIWFGRKCEGTSRIILAVLPIFVFSICGFEHCIANPFFISIGNGWSLGSVVNLVISIIGNSIGAIGFNYMISKAY